jgi:hypothetical protein
MAEALIVATGATIAWAIVGFAIPWMTRLAVLYRLHDLRDDLYDVAERFPTARETRTYRNVEFLVTMALHTVRERSYEESVGLAAVLFRRDHQSISPEDRKAAESGVKALEFEADEIFTGEDGKAALAKLFCVPSSTGWLMALRVIFGKPFVMLVFPAVMVGALFRKLLLRRRQVDAVLDGVPQMARSVPQLADRPSPRGTLDTIRILSTLIPRRVDISRALGLKQEFV